MFRRSGNFLKSDLRNFDENVGPQIRNPHEFLTARSQTNIDKLSADIVTPQTGKPPLPIVTHVTSSEIVKKTKIVWAASVTLFNKGNAGNATRTFDTL